MLILKNVIAIELHGAAGLTTLIDTEDYDKVKGFRWYSKLIPNYRGRYHATTNAKNEYGKYTTVAMHRLIMDCPKGKEVDHINGDPLDNRKGNLRVCTTSQNAANRIKSTANTSGYMGVSKHYDKWVAYIGYQGEIIHLGRFSDPKEAARAYDRKKLELFGEFAKTNGLEHWMTAHEIVREKEMAAFIKEEGLNITVEELMED